MPLVLASVSSIASFSSTPAQPWRKPTKLLPGADQAATHDRADHGVQPGAVAAACQQSDAHRLDPLSREELVAERRQCGVRVVLEQGVGEHPVTE